MGYRSEVRSLIYGPPDIVQAFWVKHRLLGNAALDGFASDITRYQIEVSDYVADGEREYRKLSVIDLQGDSWKWYEDYPDVAGWQQMLDDIEGEEAGTEGLCYEFVRLGEETDDNVYQLHDGGDMRFFLSISRSIVDEIPTQLEEPNHGDDNETTEGEGQTAHQSGVLCDAGDGDAAHR